MHKNIVIDRKIYELSNWNIYKLSKLSFMLFSKELANLGLNSIL